ncbi:MAG: hypothetical protein HYT38_02145 [Candidatus Sungbacteria bacterium]|uniref:Uncharacterized protein n=1 Tax=Candidatus Sungiibacteriota bacterium TaxID=2750080 RepID=A0A932DSG0_9BACT|nr:hypothetical protein [Candidatus Sungbacteria bacterium]MBI2466005.1 hypothetical protein [Candidatus Sungbacteria bacterium]
MRYLVYISIGLAITTLSYFVFFNREQPQSGENQIGRLAGAVPDSWETKTDEQPPIIIAVTPVEFGEDVKVWKFEIVLDTHSGSLNDDMLTVATLVDNKGNAYQPISWEGPDPGGHHREGMLIFNEISPIPEYVELKINNVGGISERSFRWNIQ